MQPDISKVETEIADLRERRANIQEAFNQATQDFDPDRMIKCRRDLESNAIRQYAFKAKLLGITREESERDRLAAVAERNRLEEQFKKANEILAAAMVKAGEARIVSQTIGAQLFALDQRVETLRQDRNEADAKQKLMVATWQDNAFKAPNELACDLD